MASLAAEIAKLVDPTPEIIDPEDEINIESLAKLSEKFDEGDAINEQFSLLRSRNAPRLDEIDNRYAGKRISRKSYDDPLVQGNSDYEDESMDDDDEHDEEEGDDDDDNDQLNIFKQQMNQHESRVEENEKIPSDEVIDDEEESEADENNESESGEDLESEGDENEQSEADEDDDEGIDVIQKFSQIDVNEELEKGKAVQKQLELWNKLCECRIKLQKLLVSANRLPQHDKWGEFIAKADKTYTESISKGYKSVGRLLNNVFDVQSELLECDLDYSMLTSGQSTEVNKGIRNNIDEDEEIPSDSEGEKDGINEIHEQHNVSKNKLENKVKKRKLKFDDFEEVLAKRHKSLAPYRNSIIQKWDEKTRMSVGRMTQKSFNAFDQSALKQINQILQDKPRLLKRTQLKRSSYSILGKVGKHDAIVEEESTETAKMKLDHLKDYDPEIFDDDDFYRQLLKDIIESKSVGMDPFMLSKQLEIHRIRSKMNRKVDTKASKGRKIRFAVHPKLVNFMAPVMTCTMQEEARDELFKSIFGQSHTSAES